MERIYDVGAVNVSVAKATPTQVIVVATGRVPSTGWINPALGAWYYIDAPSDGIQDFDFYADAPIGPSLPLMLPIVAEASITRDPNDYWGPGRPLAGVRIHARTNSLEATLEEPERAILTAGGLPLPWPFPWRKTAPQGGDLPFPFKLRGLETDDSLNASLLGKSIRVYHTGDAVTKDYRTDRVNVELNPSSERIVHVWFG